MSETFLRGPGRSTPLATPRPSLKVLRLPEIYERNRSQGRPTISFELFPPKNARDEGVLLEETVPRLMELSPSFLTVTYGAGGSTRTRTLDLAARLQRETHVEVAAHLACLDSSVEHLEEFLAQAQGAGVLNIVAIRGDAPRNSSDWRPPDNGLRYGADLVRLVKSRGPFGVAVGGYPEGHPECAEGRETDWMRTRGKVVTGADVILTQLFYENRDFVDFDTHLKKVLGVRVPIVPGVLPILSTAQIKRFTALCGARISGDLLSRLEALKDDAPAVTCLGIEHATRQCRELLDYGVPGFHFYTLNRWQSVTAIIENLGLR